MMTAKKTSYQLVIFDRSYTEINGRVLTHISAADGSSSCITGNERQQCVGTEVSSGNQWYGRSGSEEGSHCQCVQTHNPTIDEMLHGQGERPRRHATREFQKSNDGSGEGNSADENTDVCSDEL